MNGPGTDSLEIRHTPGTVPGGARPGWGLPYKQLPAATQRDLTPESATNEQIQTGRQQIQDKYALQWKAAIQSKRFVGAAKTQRMLREIDTKAKQEMLQFNQQAQQQMAQLQNIDRLVQVGALTEQQGAKIKIQETMGRDVAEYTHPTPEKEKPPMQQFADLDVYSHRISDELKWFKEDKPPKPLGRLAGLSPLTAAISMYRSSRKPKRKVRKWDPVTEDYTIKTTPEEVARYDMLRQEERDIAQRKTELYGQLGIAHRRVQPGTKGGTFSDKVTESVRPRQQIKQPRISDPLKLFN